MTSGGYGQMCENVLVSCRVSCKAVASWKEKARRNSLLRRALRCRGDWIRTSDLLNPIQERAPPKLRKVLQFQLLCVSTLSIVYHVSMKSQGFLCKLCNTARTPSLL